MKKFLVFLLFGVAYSTQAHAQSYSAQQAGREMSERELSENMKIIERAIEQNENLIEQNDNQVNSVYDILQEKYREAGHTPPNRQHFISEQ